MFSRQHYEYLADALNEAMRENAPSIPNSAWLDGFVAATMALAEAFEDDNVRFSYRQFLSRVEKQEGK